MKTTISARASLLWANPRTAPAVAAAIAASAAGIARARVIQSCRAGSIETDAIANAGGYSNGPAGRQEPPIRAAAGASPAAAARSPRARRA